MQWYVRVLQNYFNFSGRARRTEYWMFVLFNAIISVALLFVGMMIFGAGSNGQMGAGNALYGLYSLAVLIPSIAVSVRRLHDIGRSGWFLLLAFIPIIGAIVLIVFDCTEGTRGPNKYGPDPKDASQVGAGAAAVS